MTTYANAVQLIAYADGTVYEASIPADAGDRTRLIELAEQDLDQLAFPTLPRRAGARKVDLGDLDPDELEGLAAATCAQALYRLEMGDEHFTRAQALPVGNRPWGKMLPVLGPQTQRELSAASLWRLTTSVGTGGRFRDPDRWQSR